MTAPEPFDVTGPLPTGTTVLEASAGTGKTYTIGALVCRYVAEDRATLEQLLVVTFGRMASLEMRERVRAQLVAAERALADPAAARAGSDRLLAHLATAPDEEAATRRRRLATALADFDAATIATTHQFCQQVLVGLGVAGDSEPGATLVEDLDDLVVEVVDDLYVRGFARADAEVPIFGRGVALEIGRQAIGNPQARLEPVDADPDSVPGRRRRFAEQVRVEVERRKRERRLLGYDDLLSRVAAALTAADAPARERLRARWTVVLVDEFQDTDPVQWQVLERAFAGAATLVLIGDPKQAIYAFRGGDVTTYLAAAAGATTTATLATNWRSDRPLVDSLAVLLGDAELGDPGIVVREVTCHHQESRLVGAPSPAPLRLRVVDRYRFGKGASQRIAVGDARAFVADDLAADVARLLGSGATYEGRPVVAGDVAVLVGTHRQAILTRDALAGRGVPAVIAGSGSVYATPAADDWLVLLEALEAPHRAPLARLAALTPFVGLTAAELDAGGDPLTDRLGSALREWAELLASRGVAALLEVASTQSALGGRSLVPRLLEERGGERRLTDLRHVGEDLHAAAVEGGLGLAALVEWLRQRRAEAGADGSAERTRRLDSDAAAVQVVTLHASKGLEYPVVYLPFGFDRWVRKDDVLLLHDEHGQRVLDVGGPDGPGRAERERRALAELSGEALRLLYVGLTRARSQVVAWWAPTTNTPASGLHRMLFGRVAGTGAIADEAPVPTDRAAREVLDELAARGGPAVEEAVALSAVPPAGPAASTAGLACGDFTRTLDTAWRRTSYTALATAADVSSAAERWTGVASEPEQPDRDDESLPESLVPAGGLAPAAAATDGADLASPMGGLPVGAAFGTLVHAVLETTAAEATDLGAELLVRCREQLARRPMDLSAGALAAALGDALTTPLGPLAGDRTLASFTARDRRAEMTFELPLAGGDHATGRAPGVGELVLGDVAPLLRRHLGADDPLRPYAERLADPALGDQALRGYLTGSLDVILRCTDPAGGAPRYLVADYKTNRLGADDSTSVLDYRPTQLTLAMQHSSYPLQALLYAVALHRYLRWRQPGYDPEVHFGGVLYLYLRGMAGPATPVLDGGPCGVFSWRPPVALVVELSDLLAGATA